jgi:hypothetical protein
MSLEERLKQARIYAEEKLGFKVPEDEYQSILAYAVRKLGYIKKDEDYLPLLLETEITDFYMRRYINMQSMFIMTQRENSEMMTVRG